MSDFPYAVSIGLGIVLLGTAICVVWILMLDSLESQDATQEGQEPKDGQQKH
jgi:hypothetical protein